MSNQIRNQRQPPTAKPRIQNMESISIADFSCQAVLGRGHFGKVSFFYSRRGYINKIKKRYSWRGTKYHIKCMQLKHSKKPILLRVMRWEFFYLRYRYINYLGWFLIVRETNLRVCQSWQASVPYQALCLFSNTRACLLCNGVRMWWWSYDAHS